MTERAKKLLSDVLLAIESFTEGETSFEQYHRDQKTKRAVERQLAIIGEAVNRYAKEEQTVKFTNTEQIISFRNRLIHAYDNLDDAIIWVILKKHLPILKIEAIKYLNEQ